MASIVAFVAILAVCGLMLWASTKLEPHWVSKDGQRVVCAGQGISRRGETAGRWRELRITSMGNGTVEVRPRRGSLSTDRHAAHSYDRTNPRGMAGLPRGLLGNRAPRVSYWKVSGATPEGGPRRAIYVLEGSGDPSMPEMLMIRLPKNSRAVPMLEALAVNKQNPGTTQSAGPPDPH